MPGVHRLQEIERFRSSHLADNDSFGSHAQAISDEVAHGDLARALEVRRARLEPHHMGLLKLKFRGVLASDDSFIRFNIVRQAVERKVVLPEPVPPETMTLQRTCPMILSISAPAGEIDPNLTN